ncbi:MAG TPA: DUF2142 domain-containing protein [Baekduia sp.]|nr:DUF2142 domain-containing protein [Baekduia sp.]
MLRRTATAARSVPTPLALLLGLALVLGLGWSLATAPLQGFDESEHAAYAVHLAHTGEPPSPSEGDARMPPGEALAWDSFGLRRMLQNPAVRPPWRDRDADLFAQAEDRVLDARGVSAPGPNPLAKNPPLYYAYTGAVARATPGGFRADLAAMRMASVLLLVATVAVAWLVAAEIFPRTLPRTVTAGVVALHPMAGQIAGIVNTDALLMLVGTTTLWLAVRALRRDPDVRGLLTLGLAGGAALLTHGRGLPIAAFAALVLAGVVVRHRAGGRAVLRSAGAGFAGLAGAAAAYVVYVRATGGGALYGGEAQFDAIEPSLRQFVSLVWQFYLPPLASMSPRIGPDYGFGQFWVDSGFAVFGSNEVFLSAAVRDAIRLALVGGFVALLGLLVRRWERMARAPWVALTVVTYALAVVGFLHVASYRALLGGVPDPLITGRYLLPIAAVLGLGAATLTDQLPRRVGPVVGGIVLFGLLALSTAGIGQTLLRTYV